ncbi:MAG: transglycosylase domain-containing protein [Gemmatimonadaceae bacterium]|nr:transglycosylase domain-containing protein [Gemmatimonadaceae bacterium]
MRYRSNIDGTAHQEPSLSWRSLDSICPYAISAIIHSEDPLFFRHNGFWWAEIRRQLRKSRRPGLVRGVSTITQQLSRNLFLRPERTWKRKAFEALITAQIEHALPKTRILELYLNIIELGSGVWGIESASQHHFGHSSESLSIFEAVFLASLLPAPRAPLTARNGARAVRAQRRLTSLLYGSGIISRTVERETFALIDDLEAWIRTGAQISTFLSQQQFRRDASHLPSPRLSASIVLQNHCGVAQRGHYEHFLRQEVSCIRGISAWPEWWRPPRNDEVVL